MKRKNEIFSCCLVFLIVGVTLGLFFHLHSRINREKLTPHIDPEQPMVALTFDDGPNPTYTPPLLDLLYRYQAPSTFFILGEKISSNRWLLQEMVCSGHELGNHTYSHTDLTTLTPQQIEYEIDKTKNALKKILPNYTMLYVRPPYGHYNQLVEDTVEQPLILWDIDTMDWDSASVDTICEIVLTNIHDGDILVFHDNNPNLLKALERILPELQEQGFQFVTIRQLAEYRTIEQR